LSRVRGRIGLALRCTGYFALRNLRPERSKRGEKKRVKFT